MKRSNADAGGLSNSPSKRSKVDSPNSETISALVVGFMKDNPQHTPEAMAAFIKGVMNAEPGPLPRTPTMNASANADAESKGQAPSANVELDHVSILKRANRLDLDSVGVAKKGEQWKLANFIYTAFGVGYGRLHDAYKTKIAFGVAKMYETVYHKKPDKDCENGVTNVYPVEFAPYLFQVLHQTHFHSQCFCHLLHGRLEPAPTVSSNDSFSAPPPLTSASHTAALLRLDAANAILTAFDFHPDNVDIGVVVVDKVGSLLIDVYEAIQDMPPNCSETEASVFEQYSQFDDRYLVPAERGKKIINFSQRGFWNVPIDKLPVQKWHAANVECLALPSVLVVVVGEYDPSLIGYVGVAIATNKLVIFKTKEIASAYEAKFPGILKTPRQMVSALPYGSGWHWVATFLVQQVCKCNDVAQYLSQVLSS